MIPFLKGNGTGNDFVIVRGEDLNDRDRSSFAIKACHRHFGIGGDGLLILSEPTIPEADFCYEMINPDGTPSGRCGNGMRVAVLAWRALNLQFSNSGFIQIGENLHGFVDEDSIISVEVGSCIEVRLAPSEIKSLLPPVVSSAMFVDVGNPHLILFSKELPADSSSRSARLEVHPAFPNRTNVHWVIEESDSVQVYTWERGAGQTLACGSGACAIAFANPQMSELTFPGGVLNVRISSTGKAWLSGEAQVTFSGLLTEIEF